MTEVDLKVQELKAENDRLKKLVESYVCEFRVCRFCQNLHGDCNPGTADCHPKWGGL